jgi:microcystin-dependent protein
MMGVEIQVGSDWKEAADRTPVGLISAFGGTVAPDGWLMCDGAEKSRTVYADLYAVIDISFGAGNGSTTFNLPDLRGAAPAGAGTSAGYAQNETIALATKYNDQVQGHRHVMPQGNGTAGSAAPPYTSHAPFIPYSNLHNDYGWRTRDPYTDGTNGAPRNGNVTRGKRVGVNFIIKH